MYFTFASALCSLPDFAEHGAACSLLRLLLASAGTERVGRLCMLVHLQQGVRAPGA
jgi:hypothetical protein